ncbi:MAG: methylenetetrahydrofolate--tRNA-(uracil(54)-C(5))-methyltransferase (FADH(2)-oxidizing) TrmFO, partial [Anaerolineales bacterium]
AGVNAARLHYKISPLMFPRETMLGALCYYITHANEKDFQPMKANFGIVPPLTDGKKRNKRSRASAYAARSLDVLQTYLRESDFAAIETQN